MKGWQIALVSLGCIALGGAGGFLAGSFSGDVVGGFATACLTASQAVEKRSF